MRRGFVLVMALLASLALVAPANAARPESPPTGAGGKFSLTVHTHSSEFRGPGGAPTLFETDPLSSPITEGTEGEDFSYSSVSCADPAPFNDVALNFNPDYPGIEDPASVRHFVEGNVADVDKSGRTGAIEGTITTFLCEKGEEGDEIHIAYEGRFVQTSDNEARLAGTFEITGGTGRFADLAGEGRIRGSFTCLPLVLEREGAESCAELGVYSDAVFELKGTYEDPTA